MKRLLFITAWIIVALTMNAQTTLPKETPQLEFALQLNVTLGQPYTVGSTPPRQTNGYSHYGRYV